MTLTRNQQVQLLNNNRRCLGLVTVERVEGDRLFGQFAAQPEFSAVERLFREFEDAVNQQLFSHAGDISTSIDSLGLRLAVPGDGALLEIDDVQLMNGRKFCCRLKGMMRSPANEDRAALMTSVRRST